MRIGSLSAASRSRTDCLRGPGGFFRNAFGFDELPDYGKTRAELLRLARAEDDDDPLCRSRGWQRVSFDLARSPPRSDAAAAAEDAPPRTTFATGESAALPQQPPPPSPPPLEAGCFRFDTVRELRQLALEMLVDLGYTSVELDKSHAVGDSRALHTLHPNAFFQAASPLNCLEFAHPGAAPELGILGYEDDRTQGPACAAACAGAAAFRNYLATVSEETLALDPSPLPRGGPLVGNASAPGADPARYGQTKRRQLNGLRGLEAVLRNRPELGGKTPWAVRNGYVELTNDAPALMPVLGDLLANDPAFARECLGAVRVGAHYDCEATDARRNGSLATDGGEGGRPSPPRSPTPALCSQALASACSVGYSRHPAALWEPLGRLVLRAAYEATFYAYVVHRCRLERRQEEPAGPLFLTKLGGGVFANPRSWIRDAMKEAQAALQLLFDEAAAAASAGAAKRPPLRLAVLVTHYGRVEPGYEGFVDGEEEEEEAAAAAARGC
jgi:hypothetical protein